MSEEHTSRLWVCTRCGRRKNIELEPDPVLLKVCDECKIQNWCRNPKGAGIVMREAEPEPEPVIEAETVVEEEPSITVKVDLDTEEIDKKLDEKAAEIEALKAQLAELEKE